MFIGRLNDSARRLKRGNEGTVADIVKKMFFSFLINLRYYDFGIEPIERIKAYAAGLRSRKNHVNTVAYDEAMEFLFYERAARAGLVGKHFIPLYSEFGVRSPCLKGWNLKSYLYAMKKFDFDDLKRVLSEEAGDDKEILVKNDEAHQDVYPGSLMDILCERKDLTLDQKFELLQLGFKQGLILQQNTEAVMSLFSGLIVSKDQPGSRAAKTLNLYKYDWRNKNVDSTGVGSMLNMFLDESMRDKIEFLAKMLCAMYKKTGSIAGMRLCMVLGFVRYEVTLIAITRALVGILKSAKGFDSMMSVEELETLVGLIRLKKWVVEFKSLGRVLQILETPFDLDERFDMSGEVQSTVISPLPSAVGFYANGARRLPLCRSEGDPTWDPGIDAPMSVRFGSGSSS